MQLCWWTLYFKNCKHVFIYRYDKKFVFFLTFFKKLLSQTEVTYKNTVSISRALYKLLLQHRNSHVVTDFSFLSFLLIHYFLMDCQRFYRKILFYHLLPSKHVTKIGLISLVTLKKVSVRVIP